MSEKCKKRRKEEESGVTDGHLDEYCNAGVDLADYVEGLAKKYHLSIQEMRDVLEGLVGDYQQKEEKEKKKGVRG